MHVLSIEFGLHTRTSILHFDLNRYTQRYGRLVTVGRVGQKAGRGVSAEPFGAVSFGGREGWIDARATRGQVHGACQRTYIVPTYPPPGAGRRPPHDTYIPPDDVVVDDTHHRNPNPASAVVRLCSRRCLGTRVL